MFCEYITECTLLLRIRDSTHHRIVRPTASLFHLSPAMHEARLYSCLCHVFKKWLQTNLFCRASIAQQHTQTKTGSENSCLVWKTRKLLTHSQPNKSLSSRRIFKICKHFAFVREILGVSHIGAKKSLAIGNNFVYRQ